MKISKNRTTATAIALFLMLAMAISVVALPTATSQVSYISVGTRKTYAFIGANPNPVQVGTSVLLHYGITCALASVGYGWEGITITVTKPNNTTETLTTHPTDPTGGTTIWYVPTMVGTYYLQTNFPEQRMPATAGGVPVNTTMLASTSEKLALVVQQEPTPSFPGVPLPSEYWTRPINTQLWEWSPIAGDWLEHKAFFATTYATDNELAPESAHVLWTKVEYAGGLVGGGAAIVGSTTEEFGNLGYETGGAYNDKFLNSIIIAGKLYYNRFETRGGTACDQEVVAVDLHTGEELWDKPLIGRTGNTTGATVPAEGRFLDGIGTQFPNGIGRRLAFGQTFYWSSYNYMGVYGLLWTTTGTTWMAFDALTGRWIYTITDVPSGTTIRGERGELYRYTVNLANGWMALWNSSALVSMMGSWDPHGNVYNASGVSAPGVLAAGPARAWAWNITIPKGLPGSVQAVALNDKVFGANVASAGPKEVGMWAFSLVKGQEGSLLFNTTWPAPAEWAQANRSSAVRVSEVSLQYGVMTVVNVDTLQHWGFSTNTGKYLWGPVQTHEYLDIYQEAMAFIVDGRYLAGAESGTISCFNATTGELLWTYTARDPYNESPMGTNYALRAPAAIVVDGKIYGGYGEHSPNDPFPRGAPFFCINETTGEEIWSQYMSVCSYSYTPLIGDSIIATLNVNDGQVYAIGKGPSATTLTASPEVSVYGNSVLVQGMVTDTSPGTQKYALTACFPHGVPAVSDESMSEWMRYVYMQFPRPTNATGVEVILSVFDPNNNYYEVGRTTSDASGMFKLAFTPEVPGEYTVIATFLGSESYYASYAETALIVSEAPAATATPQSPIPMDYTMSIIGTGIAVIIAVAIATILLLRKRA
jgi:outer membrane protein assembly factor BamB